MKYKYIPFFLLLIFSKIALSQGALSSDELFKQARSAAFDSKNYPLAISLSKQALIKSADYIDIEVFLGRIYSWTSKQDSARMIFEPALNKHPGNEDAAFAYGSMEYWNNNSVKALAIVNGGLSYHPASPDLLLLKAKVLNDLRRYKAADSTVNILLVQDPKNSDARALADRVKDNASINKISLGYDYIHFDKQFSDPWQIVELDYSRQTSIGSIVGTINYANRFNESGLQYEVDAYPHISKIFYAYVSAAYSNKEGVFPTDRLGFSLYANLPKSFEGELGFRYLNFNGPTWIYTAALGKYYDNFRFSLRTYLTPSFNTVSRSYSLDVRYYTRGANDYFSLSLGTGVSPDDPRNIILLNNGSNYRLRSHNIAAGYRKTHKLNTFIITASLQNQEYRFQTFGNQTDIGIGYQRRF